MSTTKKQILVPIDFSDQSLIALEQSYNLAREYKAEITMLYVVDDSNVLSKLFGKSEEASMKKKIEAKMNELATETEKKTKIKINVLIARGVIYDKIVEIAELVKAVMIIMGTNGTVGVKKRFIGSNALRVVREAKCPVITIKGKHHRNGCKNIVLPLDLTKETKEKVTKAIEFAKLGNKAAIRIISVLFTTDEFVVNRLTRQLGQVKNFIEKTGIECTAEIIKGIKGEESLGQNIIDYANKVEGDLIMIMTQQEVEFTKYFIGSAAQEIINTSDIPVISIIPSMKKDTTSFVPY
ncbi:MAG: universal stress protein [Bacteroidia bacterium]